MAKQKGSGTSSEERTIQQWIKQAQQEIARKDRQIILLERMSPPVPEYRPSYQGHGHHPGFAHRAQRLKGQIERIKIGTLDKSSAVLRSADPLTKEKGNQLIVAFLYGNNVEQGDGQKQKDINASQRLAMKLRYGRKHNFMDERKQQKDISASQDYATRLIGDFRAAQERTPEKEKAAVKDLDASQDYAMKLRAGDSGKESGKNAEKSEQKDLDASQEYAAKLQDGEKARQAQEQQKTGSDQRDISASQDYAKKLIDAEKEEPGKENNKERAQPVQERNEQEAPMFSMSASFSQRLDSGILPEPEPGTGLDGMDMDR